MWAVSNFLLVSERSTEKHKQEFKGITSKLRAQHGLVEDVIQLPVDNINFLDGNATDETFEYSHYVEHKKICLFYDFRQIFESVELCLIRITSR
jgi:hypothetical protein